MWNGSEWYNLGSKERNYEEVAGPSIPSSPKLCTKVLSTMYEDGYSSLSPGIYTCVDKGISTSPRYQWTDLLFKVHNTNMSNVDVQSLVDITRAYGDGYIVLFPRVHFSSFSKSCSETSPALDGYVIARTMYLQYTREYILRFFSKDGSEWVYYWNNVLGSANINWVPAGYKNFTPYNVNGLIGISRESTDAGKKVNLIKDYTEGEITYKKAFIL